MVEFTPDAQHMAQALLQARLAAAAGEVPVGAVVVHDGLVVGTGYNRPIGDHDPSAHAEIVALRAAAARLGNYRLEDCTLYVTLEPCAMCAGAILQARLRRLVFGAREPRSGAAGSVLNLFDIAALNHHTEVQGGVLDTDCGTALQDFFRVRRAQQRTRAWPLRDDALRTPEARFSGLNEAAACSHYVNDLPSLDGLRLHYVDTGDSDASAPRFTTDGANSEIGAVGAVGAVGTNSSTLSFLCLHGSRAWSYQFRHLINAVAAAGHRAVAPDLIGFGHSDKPKKTAWHTLARHVQTVHELAERLDLHKVVLILAQGDWGCAWEQALIAHLQPRLLGVVVWRINPDQTAPSPSTPVCEAATAPFPDAGHGAALRFRPGAAASTAEAAWRSPLPCALVLACDGQAIMHGEAARLALLATSQASAHRVPQRTTSPATAWREPDPTALKQLFAIFTDTRQSPTMCR